MSEPTIQEVFKERLQRMLIGRAIIVRSTSLDAASAIAILEDMNNKITSTQFTWREVDNGLEVIKALPTRRPVGRPGSGEFAELHAIEVNQVITFNVPRWQHQRIRQTVSRLKISKDWNMTARSNADGSLSVIRLPGTYTREPAAIARDKMLAQKAAREAGAQDTPGETF